MRRLQDDGGRHRGQHDRAGKSTGDCQTHDVSLSQIQATAVIACDHTRLAERGQDDVSLAIEDVVRAKRNDVPARQDVVNAALHQPADVEVVGVQERSDRDPEDVGWRELLGERPGEKLAGAGRLGSAWALVPLPIAVDSGKQPIPQPPTLARYCSISCRARLRVKRMPLARMSR